MHHNNNGKNVFLKIDLEMDAREHLLRSNLYFRLRGKITYGPPKKIENCGEDCGEKDRKLKK